MTAMLEHSYTPHGSALQLFKSKKPQVLLSGPAGTGKSRACLEKLHAIALANPGMRGLIVRKTAVSLTWSALVTWREHVATQALKNKNVSWYGGSQQEAAGYRYRNGSVINVGGMDKPDKIMSTEYDIIYVQEAIELAEEDWEKLTTRLRNGKVSFQQLIADTNPDKDTHWLKQKANAGGLELLNSKHTENPRYFQAREAPDGGVEYEATPEGEAYMLVLDALTGVRRLRLLDGKWVAAEGIIWENWDEQIHLIDRFRIPRSWPRFWSVDFGYTHPFVLQCWAMDGDGRLYRYREIFHTKRLVEDHAATVLKHVTDDKGDWTEPEPDAVICDHQAEDRATLAKHLGMSTTPAIKNVSRGLQAVESRLKVAGDGKPRIFFLRDSLVERDRALVAGKKPTCTEEEIPGYVWNPEKDAPVKEMDDGCDTTRYQVAHHDLRNEPNVRWLE